MINILGRMALGATAMFLIFMLLETATLGIFALVAVGIWTCYEVGSLITELWSVK